MSLLHTDETSRYVIRFRHNKNLFTTVQNQSKDHGAFVIDFQPFFVLTLFQKYYHV